VSVSITDDRPRRRRREVVEADDGGGGGDDDEMVAAILDCDKIWMARMSIIHINAFFRCPDMILIH
jgi:hypothetical protein